MGKVLEFKPRDSDYWAKRIGATVMREGKLGVNIDSDMRPFDSDDEFIDAMVKAAEELEREEGGL